MIRGSICQYSNFMLLLLVVKTTSPKIPMNLIPVNVPHKRYCIWYTYDSGESSRWLPTSKVILQSFDWVPDMEI